MPSPLTEQEVLASISPIFHTEYEWLKNTHLQPNELVFAAADCSEAAEGGREFGFVVVSSYRILRVIYETRNRAKKRIYKIGSIFDEPGTLKRESCWFDLSSSLSGVELQCRNVKEIQLKNIIRVERSDHTVKNAGQYLKLIELTIVLEERTWGYLRVMFSAERGQMFYDLIQTAVQNQGGIPTEEANKISSIPGLIEALGRLHQAGVLTDQEFEQKKRELLNRL